MQSSSRKKLSELLRLLIPLFIFFAVLTQSIFFDRINFLILQTVQSFRSQFLDFGLAPFILLGSPEISISALLALTFYLYRRKQYQKTYLILAALLLLTGIEFVMKHQFVHSRIPSEFRQGFPWIPGVGAATIETPYSFPSGHSLRSMFLAGTLFLWFPLFKLMTRELVIGSLFCVQAFGMNYYGFHWLTDVIGGYWLALIGIQAVRYLADSK